MKIYSDKNKTVKTGVLEAASVSAERNFTAENDYYIASKQSSRERENTDVFTHADSSSDEIASYEKFKSDKNAIPAESRIALEELLTNLKKSRSELYRLDDEAAAYRDMLIGKIKDALRDESKPTNFSKENHILDAVMQAFEAERRAIESRVLEMKKMHTSLKIAIKTVDGLATEEEIRFLQKSTPSVYEAALAQIKARHLNDKEQDNQQNKAVEFLG